MKTVLITGCSSGYGLEVARSFHLRGWNVIATMRTPRVGILPVSDRLRVLSLEVTNAESIKAALDSSGPIDVLVNIAMTQAVVPRFRARRSGVVVNVTSSATWAPMPPVSVYTASKMAIEGFTASLEHELRAFDVRVKLVVPGYRPATRFAQNTGMQMEDAIPEPCAKFAQPILTVLGQTSLVTTEADVADAVWFAANDVSAQLRFLAGPDAVAMA